MKAQELMAPKAAATVLPAMTLQTAFRYSTKLCAMKRRNEISPLTQTNSSTSGTRKRNHTKGIRQMPITTAGWCQRCGRAYETRAQPTCECAGDPPVQYHGSPQPNFHPDKRAYLRRVRALRYVPTAADVARPVH